MQVSVKKFNFKQSITRAISVTSEKAETKQHTALKPWTEIPGPKSLPVIGTLHQFLPGGEFYKLDMNELTRKLYSSYGPIVRLGAFIGREPMVFLRDAESIEQIHRGENEFPIRKGLESLVYYRKVYKQPTDSNKPTDLISEHGKLWKDLRSTVNPVLLQPKTIKLYIEAIDEVAMEMIKRMKGQRDENNQVKDFSKQINLWSLESIGVVALGCRMNCFDPNIKEDSPVFQLIDIVQNSFKANNELDTKPSLWKLVATPAFKKAMKTYEKQEILARYFIDEAVKEIERNPKPDDKKGVLEKLLDINKDFAYIMASDMLLAGVDTCQVVFSHQHMSLMEQYFVKADKYIPERWIAEKDDPLYYRNAHPFAYNPFGFGVRSCIGRRIAELEMETFIGRAIENFEIEWFGPPPKQLQTSLNYVVGPLNFIFKDAKM